MADGDNVILGQENDADNETQLHSTGADSRYSALFVLNDNGQAIQGTGSLGFPGVSGYSDTGDGVSGYSHLGNGVFGVGSYGVTGWGNLYGLSAVNPKHGVQVYLATDLAFPGPGGGRLAAWVQGGAYVDGNLDVNGTKSAVVKHPDGSNRRLYCMESPESWFEDFGIGQLKGGQADVHLDRDFAALVRTDNYHVFLTPYGDSNGLYIAHMQPDGFVVREQHGGKHSLEFGYRVVAKRGDVDVVRLVPYQLPAQPVAPQPPPRQPRRA